MIHHVDYESGVTRIRSDWLVVVEWLGDRDEKTGTELVRHLTAKQPGMAVELVVCHSRAEFLAAIVAVEARVPELGIPTLHIESHGYNIYGDGAGFRGPDPKSGEAIVLWKDLEASLSALNVASGFALIVVTAACLSDTVLFTISHDRPAPFLLLVAFGTEVSWSTLEAAMKTLYTRWRIDEAPFDVAFVEAKAALNPHEKLGLSLVSNLVANVVEDVARMKSSKKEFERLYLLRSIQQRLSGRAETRLDALRAIDALLVAYLDRMVAVMLGYDRFQGNRARFKVEASQIARRVFQQRRWSV
ncbi:hypothetical protein [Luteibacter jiangsuensis]